MALPSNFFTTQSVLVVDDIDTVRTAVKGMLQMLGCKDIHVANNGERALDLCKQRDFDFILCDFNLGKGKDGYQLFEELKLLKLIKSNTLFIILSAETTIQTLHGIFELQPDDYLLKPFSYKKLKSRLVKAFEKREILVSILDAITNDDYQGALTACDSVSKLHPNYTLPIMRIKAEVFIKLGHYKQASKIYSIILATRELGWAKLGKAITYYHLGELPKAIILLKQLTEGLETKVEALNWLAKICVKKNRLELVEETLIESVKISPKNVSRQRALANFSSLNDNLDVALRCFKTILSNTYYSIHDNINHHFNYVHCLLDKAKNESQLQRVKLILEAQMVLKNAKNRFEQSTFLELEKVALARIAISRNALQEANTTLAGCDEKMVISHGNNNVLQLAKAWFELGNYESYQTLMKLLPKETHNDDLVNVSEILLIEKINKQTSVKIAKLLDLNQQGLALYKSGLYEASTTAFLEAFQLIPNNLQLSLNLAQSISKAWPIKENYSLKKMIIKQCVQIIESQSIPIEGMAKARYESFEHDLKKVLV